MNPLKSLRHRSCGCCLLFVLLCLLLVGGLFFLAVRAAQAAPPLPQDREIVLAIDNSPSMWDCDGVGTDPQMLRVDAARLFIQYLGADSSAAHRLALLHFGGEVRHLAPLTDLADAAGRQRLLQAASRQEPIRWTDQRMALEAAQRLLAESGGTGSHRLIVLLTDGEPAPGVATNDARYVEQLEAVVKAMADEGTSLAVVLLSDQSTSCGRAVAANWAGRWARLAGLTPGGALYTANQAEELLPVYHAIVRELSGVAAGAAPATTATLAQGEPLTVPVPVEGALTGLVITVWKAEAATTVEVLNPAGRPLTAEHAGVTVTGGDAGQREQVWRVAQPQRGVWQVRLSGRGRVSVWQDRILPAPTATATPTGTTTPTATRTPTATASATPAPAASPTHAASATPRPTLTASPSPSSTLALSVPVGARPTDAQRGAGRPVLPWLLGTGMVLAVGGVAVAGSRLRGPYLTGQLAPVAVPAGVALTLPRDLGSERRRQVYLGRRGQREWQLAGWPGTLRLTADRSGGVLIVPVAGEVTVDGQPVRHARPLADGAVIGCGEYRIRYENLLH